MVALRGSLEQVRYELVPITGVEDQLAFLPAGATVTVTSSPSRGMEATFELCDRLADRYVTLGPPVAARLVRDRAHVRALLRRLDASGISRVFVVAGDASEPAGPYEGAAALLREMADVGHDLVEVGVTGYPESHAFITDDDTIRAMTEKTPYATTIVSQMCFDASVIAGWIAAVRARGVELPIHIGIPGAVDLARLLRVSLKVGMGDSVRFVRKQARNVGRLATGYTPDRLVDGLAAAVAAPRPPPAAGGRRGGGATTTAWAPGSRSRRRPSVRAPTRSRGGRAGGRAAPPARAPGGPPAAAWAAASPCGATSTWHAGE
jgi:methylenetetrahydrofolate reductase (NADPH)